MYTIKQSLPTPGSQRRNHAINSIIDTNLTALNEARKYASESSIPSQTNSTGYLYASINLGEAKERECMYIKESCASVGEVGITRLCMGYMYVQDVCEE